MYASNQFARFFVTFIIFVRVRFTTTVSSSLDCMMAHNMIVKITVELTHDEKARFPATGCGFDKDGIIQSGPSPGST